MKTISNKIDGRLLERVEIPSPEGELGLSDGGDLAELAAREAASYLVWRWDSQFHGLDNASRAIIVEDVSDAIGHLNRWRENLLKHPELFQKE